ncbi:uncharacterized protein LOC120165035 [Hibiscus syriacus]|uniref:uncharacterized protein LOC120165035 n=1 Tax=Hibiscus syriacus TaxID=106335 RepID=UPI001922D736|nr:uncharacterized protein LOC120165035 [Hibiscus syriacus]
MWIQDHFKPRPSDIFLATSPKIGTTWLKALIFTTVNRTRYRISDHPLLTTGPHNCFPFLDTYVEGNNRSLHELDVLPSPRILSTHLPFGLLPNPMTDDRSCREVSDMKIKEGIWGQGNDKSLGPNGYNPYFFKRACPIIGEDFKTAINYCFDESFILPSFNVTAVVLVPKVPNLNTSAFVKGRSIVDNTLLAQEIVRDYGRKNNFPRCAMKIDLQKAFDSLIWEFVSVILYALGLPEKFIGWIWACFTTPNYSIMFNGSLVGYFKGTRGVRQGDPISPYLFVLAMNILFGLLNVATLKRSFKFHPKYVFYSISGLNLNATKCEVYTARITAEQCNIIQEITSFKLGVLPVRCLGVPLVTRKLAVKDCQCLIDKISAKLNSWVNRYLSFVGRLQLI